MNGKLQAMTFPEFNQRFLWALAVYRGNLKHTASGSNGRHPLLKATLLADCRDDIKNFGFEATKKKWQHFIGG